MSINEINNSGNIQSFNNSPSPPFEFTAFGGDSNNIAPPLSSGSFNSDSAMRNNFPPGIYPLAIPGNSTYLTPFEISTNGINSLTAMQTQLKSGNIIYNWVSSVYPIGPELGTAVQNLQLILPNAINLLKQSQGFSDPYVSPETSVLAVNTILDTVYNISLFICSYGAHGSLSPYPPYTSSDDFNTEGTNLVNTDMLNIPVIVGLNSNNGRIPINGVSGTDQINSMIAATQSAIQLLLSAPLPLSPVTTSPYDGAFKSVLDLSAIIEQNYQIITSFPSITNSMINDTKNPDNTALCISLSMISTQMGNLLKGF